MCSELAYIINVTAGSTRYYAEKAHRCLMKLYCRASAPARPRVAERPHLKIEPASKRRRARHSTSAIFGIRRSTSRYFNNKLAQYKSRLPSRLS
ncbi:hypothetical protein EVAR_18826_1 [Eumeta japonica]|uniref:Uncharacterized protein n=1 Tax=Eumeta variegata TaxID=151549 RepID=A0A4C1UMY1_EUMVA|nr:hypothetical protein EVAR_18826_1 [Eumeta japonica]